MNIRKIFFLEQNHIAIILIWILWLVAYPFVFYSFLNNLFIIPILIALCTLILLLFKKKKIRYNNNFIILFIGLSLFWLFQLIYRVDIAYVSNIFQLFTVLILYLTLANLVKFKMFIEIYVRVLVIVSVIGCIGAFIVFFLNLEPLFSFSSHDGRMNNFFYLTFSNTYFQVFDRTIIRFSGIFDEPGTLAFYSLYGLIFNKLILENKKYENILLIAPIFTFSIAHLLVVFVYLIFFKVKSLKIIILCIIILILSYNMILSLKNTEYERIYTLTIARFEVNETTGEFKGNNRVDLMEDALKYWEQEPILGHGKTLFENSTSYIGANIFYIGAMYGILGYLFLFIFFEYSLALCFNRNNFFLTGVKCCLLLLIIYMQRPDVTNIFQLSNLLLFTMSISFSLNHKLP